VTICCDLARRFRLISFNSSFIHAWRSHCTRKSMEQVAMRRVTARVMLTVALLGVRFASASETGDGRPSLTIQIHDYARVPGDLLSRATAIVTRIYAKVGVRAEWMDVAHPAKRRAAHARRHEASPAPAAQVTIIILTPGMAARAHVAENVLGYAAVPDQGMGTIAFAIYERVRAAARKIPTSEAELLGFVIAHEIGHLLLPRGSQLGTGPMKDHWHIRDLERLDLLTLDFSTEQARQIRSTLETR
jgi:hypothetical protein